MVCAIGRSVFMIDKLLYNQHLKLFRVSNILWCGGLLVTSSLELRGSVLKEAVRERRADTTSSFSREMASDMASLV
jgi:hypothetical protein